MHTHNFWCAKTDKIFWCIEDLLLIFSVSHLLILSTYIVKFPIAGQVKNQQWWLRLRRPAAAVIETVMRRGSVYTGRVKDSSTHTHQRRGKMAEQMCGPGKDGFRWGAREGKKSLKSTGDGWQQSLRSLRQQKPPRKSTEVSNFFSSHSRDVEHHKWKVHLGEKNQMLNLPH